MMLALIYLGQAHDATDLPFSPFSINLFLSSLGVIMENILGSSLWLVV